MKPSTSIMPELRKDPIVGRWVIIAPDRLTRPQILREEFAHERLGIAKAQMAQWLDEAGLSLVDARDLVPAGAVLPAN